MTSKIHYNIANKIGSLESTLKSQRELLEVNPNMEFTNEMMKDVLATYPEKIRKLKKFNVKNFNTFTPTAKDFEEFVEVLAKNNVNFHPEDDFNDYTNADGSKTFYNKHIATIINDNFTIAKDTLSEKVFWKICYTEKKEIDYVKHFAKLIAERFPDGNVDVASEVDSIQMDENLDGNAFITSMSFDSKVREKLSELWEQVDCDKCNGKGYYYDDDGDLINCPRCHGEGTHTKLEKGE